MLMPRTKNIASHDTKRRLLGAAVDQFHRKGYNGTSVKDLVDAAGAPKGTFYNHFASKEELALEALSAYVDVLEIASLADPGQGSPRARIDAHLAHIVELGLSAFAERGCMLANLAGEVPAHSPVVAAAVGAYLEAWAADLTRLIDAAKDAGELTTDQPSADLAELIVTAFEGGSVKAKATSSVEPIRSFQRTVGRLLQ
jgi:TetR/AcrR family transcriptional regulator, transcriptional repressor for nem operon